MPQQAWIANERVEDVPLGGWCPDGTLDELLDSSTWMPEDEIVSAWMLPARVPQNARWLGPALVFSMDRPFGKGRGLWGFQTFNWRLSLVTEMLGSDLGNTVHADSWVENAMDHAARRLVNEFQLTLREPTFEYVGLLKLDYALLGVYDVTVEGRVGTGDTRTCWRSFEEWFDDPDLFPSDRTIIERLQNGYDNG